MGGEEGEIKGKGRNRALQGWHRKGLDSRKANGGGKERGGKRRKVKRLDSR